MALVTGRRIIWGRWNLPGGVFLSYGLLTFSDINRKNHIHLSHLFHQTHLLSPITESPRAYLSSAETRLLLISCLLLCILLYCIINTPESYHLHSSFSISILAVNSPKTCDTLGATETPQINILLRSLLGHDIKTRNNTSTKICTNDHMFLQATSLHPLRWVRASHGFFIWSGITFHELFLYYKLYNQ